MDTTNKTMELKTSENLIKYNYQILNTQMAKEVAQIGTQVLSEPSTIYLKVIEQSCPHGHIVKMIKQFALAENFCSIHNTEFEKDPLSISSLEVRNFVVKTITNETLNLFFELHTLKDFKELSLYDKLDVKGFPITIKSKNSGVFTKGLFCTQIATHIEELSKQSTMLTLPNVIEKLMSGKPKLNYPEEVWTMYKHSLLLPLVLEGINILVCGEAGSLKTEFSIELQKISGGSRVDVPNATSVGVIGCIIKDISGQYSFQGGSIFDARNNVLIADETDKIANAQFFQPLNQILANGRFLFNKATIKMDKEFPMSFIGFGNPYGITFKGIPKHEIQKTFPRNADFLSRMHLMFALKNKGIEFPKINASTDLNDIKIYILMAKQIKINKALSKEVEEEVRSYASRQQLKSNDLRFQKKFLDLCYAEAKLNLHKDVQLTDVKTIEKIIEIQDKLLYDY